MSASGEVDLDAWRQWSPASQEKALALLQSSDVENWTPFYCSVDECDGAPHVHTESGRACNGTGRSNGYAHRWVRHAALGYWACSEDGCDAVGTDPPDGWDFPHARADQHPPTDADWFIWLMLAGRGAGKTRAGSEWVHRIAEADPGCRIALIAPTRDDIRDTMIEGESGLLATAKPGQVPEFEPSKMRLTWPNGSIATGYSGEKPNRLRGKQFDYGWIDEPAFIELIDEVWSNFLLGLRLGEDPKVCLTTSPLNVKWLRDIVNDKETRISRATSYANVHNLPRRYKINVLGRYEGTRLGRQEIGGELLGDVEGALWQQSEIDSYRATVMPAQFDRIVVGLDPAGTAGKRSDETGMIVVGLVGLHFYVLADYSDKYSPTGWALRALRAVDEWKADALVVETTYGKDMVTTTIERVIEDEPGILAPRIIDVDSRRGKAIRAEPISALYEKGRAHHVGEHVDLEAQLTSWKPGQTGDSPDRMDALVHAMTELAVVVEPGSIATPYSALKQMLANRRTGRRTA